MAWGLVGTLVGLVAALQLVNPAFNLGTPWLSFGRLRPPHTNAVIFAFAGNAIFTGVYYSSQRLCKARNVVGVSLAMTGVLNPLVAAVLMPLSSLTVIVSSYRARTFRPREEATRWT